MKFSVVIPCYQRHRRLQRCLDSLRVQRFRDFEAIVVDDGSNPPLDKIVARYGKRFRCLRIPHGGRVVARNEGMVAAGGEWICWLDSDDAYDQEYLAAFAWYIDREPEAALWVGGAVVHSFYKDDKGRAMAPAYTKLRPAWNPPLNGNGDGFPVHSHFPSGKIGTGMFVFRRECLEATGLMPAWGHIRDMCQGVDDWLGYETGYSWEKKWIGNPWGDDWVYFRKLTMHYRVHLMEACLYVHYVR